MPGFSFLQNRMVVEDSPHVLHRQLLRIQQPWPSWEGRLLRVSEVAVGSSPEYRDPG